MNFGVHSTISLNGRYAYDARDRWLGNAKGIFNKRYQKNMSEPLLSDFLGVGVTQDENTITIQKSGLELTPDANNRGEQVFAAILKRAAVKATDANFATNPDQSITIAPGFDSTVFRTIEGVNQTWQQKQYTVNFAKLSSDTGITPDDY